MNLKRQPRAGRTVRRPTPRRARGGFRALAVRGRGARRPSVPLARRMAARLPSPARMGAVACAILAAAALVALLNGPWLRVADIAYGGHRHTVARELEEALASQRGQSVLAVDTAAIAARVSELPAVAGVTVRATLLGRLEATVTEHDPVLVWDAPFDRLLVAADGIVFATLPEDSAEAAELSALPRVTDRRFVARSLSPGDSISQRVIETALRLIALDPAALGSTATDLTLRLDDEYGFRLVSAAAGWEIALGRYGSDPTETDAEAAARLERQVAAVRTLFAERPEAEIGWVDVRNPGKVYFRAKG